MKLDDITGRRFGKLTALHQVESKTKHTCWLCQCDCGTEKAIRACNLKSRNTVSCGCTRRSLVDITGRIYGKLTVLGRADNVTRGVKTLWQCQCVCGTVKALPAKQLHKIKSCGCSHSKPRVRAKPKAKSPKIIKDVVRKDVPFNPLAAIQWPQGKV